MLKQDHRRRKKLRVPLDIGEKKLVIAKLLKKKEAPGSLYKSTTENKPFFNRNEIFKINKRVTIDSDKTYYDWIEKDGKTIRNRFYRQELFALRGQFE